MEFKNLKLDCIKFYEEQINSSENKDNIKEIQNKIKNKILQLIIQQKDEYTKKI